MGKLHIDPATLQAFHLFMATWYVLSLAGFVEGVFGFVRTAATRLPIPRHEPLNDRLFVLDIGPSLTSYHGKWRQVQKLVVYAGIGTFFGFSWVAVLYNTYAAGDRWFGWSPTVSVWLTSLVHLVVLAVFTVPFARRARSHANRFTKQDPTA